MRWLPGMSLLLLTSGRVAAALPRSTTRPVASCKIAVAIASIRARACVRRKSSSGAPHAFVLDGHDRFETGKPMLVCGNTFDMPALSRHAPYFEPVGDKDLHYSLFDCASDAATSATVTAGCC